VYVSPPAVGAFTEARGKLNLELAPQESAPQITKISNQSRKMARVCSIRGSRVRVGGRIHRSGLAKKKGGIGRHVTKVVKRSVSPNLHTKRVYIPELDRHVKVKLSAKAIKTINKNGAYATLKKAGLI
jgi:large subunit ribosomal protein L28